MGADAPRLRLTRAGQGCLLLTLGAALAAGLSHDPRAAAAAASLGVLLAAAAVLSRWNLAEIQALRRLPEEIYADHPASGAFRLSNGRRWLPAWGVTVMEEDASAAVASFAEVQPGATAEVPARWWFVRRGTAALVGVRLVSEAPFGLIEASRHLSLPGTLLVYPALRAGGRVTAMDGHGGGREGRRGGAAGGGDLVGLRPYTPGDPLHSVHWPTSARAGQPIVVLRATDVDRHVVVEVDVPSPTAVPSIDPLAREHALSTAAGAVDAWTRQGAAVGLRLDGRLLPPRQAPGWRRTLLEVLALAEPAPP